MKHAQTLRLPLAVCAASAVFSAGAAYAFDIFIEIPGIMGDATSADFDGQIRANSVELASRTEDGSVSVDQLTFEQFTDSASPLLWEAMWNGTLLPTLTIRTALTANVIQVIQLTNVRVRSMSQSGPGDLSTDVRVSVSFDSLEVTSTDSPGAGSRSATAGYDLTTEMPQ